jgi:hypothetical protein
MPPMADNQLFREPPGDFLTYRPNVIIALMDNEDDIKAAFEELKEAGLPENELFVLSGKRGAERLDPSGRTHGIRGRLSRLVDYFGDQTEILQQHARHMEQGGFGVAVPADESQVETVSETLHRHGAHDAYHLGKGHWEQVGP